MEEVGLRIKKKISSHQFYSWLVIALCGSFMIYKYVLQVSPSVMTAELMNEFRMNGVGMGHLAAYFFYSFAITQVFSGYLIDKYNPRFLTACAVLLCAVGAYFFAISHTLVLAEISRTLMGIGAAFATVNYMKMTSVWFKPQQRAFVSGLLSTGVMAGAILGQSPLSLLVTNLGWRQSLIVCALIGVIIAFLIYTFVRNKSNGSMSGEITHEESEKKAVWSDVIAVLKSKQNWLLTLYSGLVFSPIDAFAGLWSIPFLKESYHLDYTRSAIMVSFIFLGLGIGSPLLGWLSDYLGKRIRIMWLSALISLVAICSIIYINPLPLWLLGFLFFVFGFFTGAFMIGFTVARDINSLIVAATIVSLINTGDVVFGAVTEPLIGKFLDWGWSGVFHQQLPYFTLVDYQQALTLLPVYIIVAIILLFFIKEPLPAKNK